ncbi:hypothetical protein COU61_01350 [Candidatus Pacearchaeota archaeon CG10_big_fil_rev_8_21_14_0_10_35_13]|nr:MAG: hypothetical protein COU61_01350 [Candidatus Pacearchaeota archaeon CG10_big_fil_rev_8_21_14_0_10_35_13]
MKKGVRIFLFLSIVALLLIPLVLSQTDPSAGINDNLGDAKKIVDKVQNVSQNFNSADTAKSYLRQEWEKVIAGNKYLGPVYSFLTSKTVSLIFKILFAEPFALSWAFLIVVVLWFYFQGIINKAGWGFGLKDSSAILVGVAGAIILAQLRLYRGIVYIFGLLIFSPEAWWFRALIALFMVVLLVIVKALSNVLAARLKKAREEKAKGVIEQEAKRIEEKKKGEAQGERTVK